MKRVAFVVAAVLLAGAPAAQAEAPAEVSEVARWTVEGESVLDLIDAARAESVERDLAPVRRWLKRNTATAGDFVPGLVAILATEDQRQQASAYLLGAIGSPTADAAIPPLIECLRRAKDPVPFATALGAFGEAASPAVPLLEERAGEPFLFRRGLPRHIQLEAYDARRLELFDVIAEIDAKRGVAVWLDMLEGRDEQMKFTAIEHIGKMGWRATPVVSYLETMLDDDDFRMRRATAIALVLITGEPYTYRGWGPGYDDPMHVAILESYLDWSIQRDETAPLDTLIRVVRQDDGVYRVRPAVDEWPDEMTARRIDRAISEFCREMELRGFPIRHERQLFVSADEVGAWNGLD